MKKILLITGVLLALTASVASAAGVNLYWNDCGPAGATHKNFACTTNVGNHDLYVSVDPPPGVTGTNGHNHFIDLQSLSDPLPAWWDFKNAGTCRLLSLSASGDFTIGPSGGAACEDPWQGFGSADVAAYTTSFSGDPRRARIIGNVSVTSTLITAMNPGTEYYSIRFRINSLRTVGTGSCAGCLDPVCIVLNEVRIAQPPGTPGGTPSVTNPLISNFVTWQGGAIGGPGCPAATPTRNTTWGKVKSLYR